MGAKGSSPCSQKLAICPYLEPDANRSTHPQTLLTLDPLHYCPQTYALSPFKFCDSSFYTFLMLYAFYIPHQSDLLRLSTVLIHGEEYKVETNCHFLRSNATYTPHRRKMRTS